MIIMKVMMMIMVVIVVVVVKMLTIILIKLIAFIRSISLYLELELLIKFTGICLSNIIYVCKISSKT